MTPAIKLLKQKKVEFTILPYDHDPKNTDFGAEAVAQLGLDPNLVFKTLVVDIGAKDFVVAVIPVAKKLCLKSIASVFSAKKANMADKQKAQVVTGYLLGGISPLGQKKLLKTIIDNSANSFNDIYISGGRRGLDIKIAPQDLAQLTKAQFYNITTA